MHKSIVCTTLVAVAVVASAWAGETGSAELRLRSGSLSGPEADAGLPASLRLSAAELAAGGPVLLKFDAASIDRAREAAEARGIRVEAYLGDGGFVGTLPHGGIDRATGLEGLQWSAPYHPGLRIAPSVLALSELDSRETIPITVHLFSHADAAQAANELAALGLDVRGVSQGRASAPGRALRQGRVVALAAPADIVRLRAQLARRPDTFWIDHRPVYRLLNDASAWVGQSGLDAGQATPVFDNGLRGEGQVIGVLDTGLDADMCFFRDDGAGLPPVNVGLGAGTPDPTQRKVIIVNFLWTGDNPGDPTDWDSNGHGTHVAGSAAGDNLATPGVRDGADGMAPAAKLVIQDGGYATDNCADLPAIGCPAADLYPFFEQAWLEGARIHSNSYGDREGQLPYNIYTEGSEAADAFMWDYPEFLLLFAAGNNGVNPGSVHSPATAKKVSTSHMAECTALGRVITMRAETMATRARM